MNVNYFPSSTIAAVMKKGFSVFFSHGFALKALARVNSLTNYEATKTILLITCAHFLTDLTFFHQTWSLLRCKRRLFWYRCNTGTPKITCFSLNFATKVIVV